MVHWVKGLGSSPQSFRLMLRHRFNPQLGNFHMPWVPKKKKKCLQGLKHSPLILTIIAQGRHYYPISQMKKVSEI